MASLKCSFCGNGIHYHGIPNGTKYIFCKMEDWQEIEQQNLRSDEIELEYYEKFIEAWKCPKCGTFAFFEKRVHVSDIYTPNKENSTDEMSGQNTFGVFFNDYLWDEITENNISAKYILKTYPQHLWILKNQNEMRIFSDKKMTNSISQYLKIEVADNIPDDDY